MSKQFFDQGPLPERVFRGWVRRVRPSEPVQCAIASVNWWHTLVHYFGRSTGCLRSKEKCAGCRMNWPRKMLVYLFIRNEFKQRYEHLELPFDAAKDLQALIGNDELLRGTRFKATRLGKRNGPVRFELLARLDEVAPGFELKPDCDPGDMLEYLWGVNLGRLKLSDSGPLPEANAS